LTVRVPGLNRRPWRVALDARLRLPLRSRLAAGARELPTLVVAGEDAPADAETRLRDCGVVIERVARDADGHVDLGAALTALSARGITRVFSEGGPSVAARLIALGLADEVAIFTAEKPFGRPGLPALSAEARAALAAASRYRVAETAAYGPDTMRVWTRR
jgi:diaminohydroxyphosphoribosylaminopyrimidine deaminase/5-amino-6-(5-phosphoribosylamino)uracil reductase